MESVCCQGIPYKNIQYQIIPFFVSLKYYPSNSALKHSINDMEYLKYLYQSIQTSTKKNHLPKCLIPYQYFPNNVKTA